jgi:hydroxyethylthiazole kinase-like uncharacterized protein yjeF
MIPIDRALIRELYRPLNSDASKWSRGHALIIAGSRGKIGASILAASACMRTGAGMLTVHVPQCGEIPLHVSLPEAMLSLDENNEVFSQVPALDQYQVIGVGPGLGRSKETQEAFRVLLHKAKVPMVIDADALNILSMHSDLLGKLPTGSVLTPHEREFQRLIGMDWKTIDDRDSLAKAFAKDHQLTLILKEQRTRLFCPDGEVYVHTLGNAGLSKAGNGDVLTGIITGLKAQGYPAKNACLLALYIQGVSADSSVKSQAMVSLMATDVISGIGSAIKKLST